ncbi:protein disulfide oxidoreductase [Campylobacter novaezeelandiae]|uniref:protein-disulfide oxidoreductase DsbI n=1 Tax=Campylobacter novaezeelandiae TaxID=2267891 RepID=UPI001C1DEEBE|nr:protein-disulfide oxidoreductase DsbI [Campylobacter novaezeelandiae]QWU80081.1 protein disulfide oxidoreductase [Campylobacter novaezeelandiae]
MSCNLLEKIYKWQDTRIPWAIILFVTLGLTFIAHFLFQEYLFMEPCEQCVYIRFDMFVMALGAIIVLINPKSDIAKIFGYTFGFYGIWLGFEHCLLLNHIHEVVHSENPFAGVDGCRETPIYPFNLPLHEWFPSWFLPTGECGMDTPVVPESAYANLDFIQKFFVGNPPNFEDGFYSNGWYLIPKWQFLNMAICCLIAFICCLLILFLMFISFVLNKKRARVLAVIIFIFIVTLKITGKPRTPVELVSINENCKISLFLNNA